VADDDHVDVHLLFTIASLLAIFNVLFPTRISIDEGWRRQINVPHDGGCFVIFEVTKGVVRSLGTSGECSDTTAMMRRGA
jgi:hypothetical protein